MSAIKQFMEVVPPGEVNQSLVDALEGALEVAKSGHLMGAGLVLVRADRNVTVQSTAIDGGVHALCFGLALLQQDVLNRSMLSPAEAMAAPSEVVDAV